MSLIVDKSASKRAFPALGLLLLLFFAFAAALPLRTAVMLGADEGFELAKATLCLRGYHLYSQIWNDQPPLLTALVTGILKHFTLSPLGPRLLTDSFSAILLSSLFFIVLRASGLCQAALAALFLIASPGFLILGSTCMLEAPALATAIAALAVLFLNLKAPIRAVIAGILFGVSFEIKLINVILLPVAALVICCQAPRPMRAYVTKSLLLLGAALVVSTVVMDYLCCGGAYLSHFQTAFLSHFGPVTGSGHGSPEDHPFDWMALARNWDVTAPAILGCVVCFRNRLNDPLSLLPLAWAALELVVFGLHRPWWHYYIIHTSVPFCWCASIGWVALFRWASSARRPIAIVGSGLGLGVALIWMGARVGLEISEARRSPQTYSSLFLQEIARRKPDVQWMYCEEPVYSFHAQIPMPPDLAVVMLKRFWSGEISDQRIADGLADYKPGLMLLRNNSAPRPFRALIETAYHLIYQDNDHLLYLRNDLAKTAQTGRAAARRGPSRPPTD